MNFIVAQLLSDSTYDKAESQRVAQDQNGLGISIVPERRLRCDWKESTRLKNQRTLHKCSNVDLESPAIYSTALPVRLNKMKHIFKKGRIVPANQVWKSGRSAPQAFGCWPIATLATPFTKIIGRVHRHILSVLNHSPLRWWGTFVTNTSGVKRRRKLQSCLNSLHIWVGRDCWAPKIYRSKFGITFTLHITGNMRVKRKIQPLQWRPHMMKELQNCICTSKRLVIWTILLYSRSPLFTIRTAPVVIHRLSRTSWMERNGKGLTVWRIVSIQSLLHWV